MIDKIQALWPEIALFITTCIVMVIGLSPSREIRKLCSPICALGLIVAGYLAYQTTPLGAGPLPHLALYGKLLVAGIGLLLLMLMAGVADREYEKAVAFEEKRRGVASGIFDAIRATRGEFYSFFLFSLTGLMLCAGADDLIWLFLALELTSLPTYVMVAISTSRNRSMEAGVKYFFLGALGAAMFLYGFALIYGGTGTTNMAQIQAELSRQVLTPGGGSINTIALLGFILAIVGILFKIAAVPMHFYTPDVYEGAASPVAAFLAFVPKSAGFFAIMLLTACVGWRFPATFGAHASAAADHGSLPEALRITLWIVAALTMTVGNVLAILQTSVKRVLAYSSIAHSGYMLVGIIAGPGTDGRFASSGLAAVLFYLLCYGVMNIGGFAVLSCLERKGRDGKMEEADSFADIRGLCHTRPLLGWIMVLSSMGLLGLPPLLGFMGKVPLFSSGLSAGEYVLVVVLGLNSAIAAYYYLRLAYAALIEKPESQPALAPITESPFPSRAYAGVLSAAGVVLIAILGGNLADQAGFAAHIRQTQPVIIDGSVHAASATSGQPEPLALADQQSPSLQQPASKEPAHP
ncbi:MAG: NADH-quinone oxidoreductase subunit N [Pyrinomonadaceae bacterium]|nr:NADH-quinone oxidoreductase subunit N [Phycisphaerales bacterium]